MTEQPLSGGPTVTMDRDHTITATFREKQFTLTASAGSGGSISVSPKKNSYPCTANTKVKVTAAADTGYRLGSWSGAGSGTGSVRTITMDGDKTVSVTFSAIPATYPLTIVISPSGCGRHSGAGSYASGASVSIEATAKTGCLFKNWTGNGIEDTSDASTTVTMGSAPKTITANFTRQCTLAVKANPTAGGITWPTAGSTYTRNPCPARISLLAYPNTGYKFVNWTGSSDIASASSFSTHITMSGGDNKNVTANFILTSCTLTVRVLPSGSGTTTPSVGPHPRSPCPPKINLSVTPNSAHYFSSWSGGVASTSSASTHVTMSDGVNKTVTARLRPYLSVSPSASPSSWGTVSGGGNKYRSGDSVTLRATAKVPASGYGYYFRHWKEGSRIVSTSSTWTFRVYFNRSPVAVFDSVCNTEFPCGWAADDTPP